MSRGNSLEGTENRLRKTRARFADIPVLDEVPTKAFVLKPHMEKLYLR